MLEGGTAAGEVEAEAFCRRCLGPITMLRRVAEGAQVTEVSRGVCNSDLSYWHQITLQHARNTVAHGSTPAPPKLFLDHLTASPGSYPERPTSILNPIVLLRKPSHGMRKSVLSAAEHLFLLPCGRTLPLTRMPLAVSRSDRLPTRVSHRRRRYHGLRANRFGAIGGGGVHRRRSCTRLPSRPHNFDDRRMT